MFMVLLILMIFRVNLFKRMSIIILMLWEMKPNGSLSMLVILIDIKKLHFSLNFRIEKKALFYRVNISILDISQ